MSHKTPSPLPEPNTINGSPRKVGVEIELGGLDEAHVARVIAATFSGEITEKADKLVVTTPELGDIEVYLDTRFRARLDSGPDRAKEIAAAVVPVEIVTQPLLPEKIARLDDLVRALHSKGASGTKDGVLLGFGVHFNPEVRSVEIRSILPVLTTFALLEDHIRDADPIDPSRALLPFVNPYPSALIDALACNPPETLEALIDTYLDHAPSRDHALDMTCVFALHDEERTKRKMDLTEVSARPTFHYRLPDFRPGDPEWSLSEAWNRWVWIETLSAQTDLQLELRKAWMDHRDKWFDTRHGWANRSAQILKTHSERSVA